MLHSAQAHDLETWMHSFSRPPLRATETEHGCFLANCLGQGANSAVHSLAPSILLK
jgi:hypothetical protein